MGYTLGYDLVTTLDDSMKHVTLLRKFPEKLSLLVVPSIDE